LKLIRVSAAVICGIAVSLVTGCAKPFPERLNWYGSHPALYTRAFDAAATDAVAKALTGQNYYELLGDAAYQLQATDLPCDQAGLEAYFFAKTRACFLTGAGPWFPDCQNEDGCVGLRYDPQLFSDPRIRAAVEAALRDPCSHLTPPDQVKYPTGMTRFFLTARDSWRIMLCERETVRGTDIVFNDEVGEIRMKFVRATDARSSTLLTLTPPFRQGSWRESQSANLSQVLQKETQDEDERPPDRRSGRFDGPVGADGRLRPIVARRPRP